MKIAVLLPLAREAQWPEALDWLAEGLRGQPVWALEGANREIPTRQLEKNSVASALMHVQNRAVSYRPAH